MTVISRLRHCSALALALVFVTDVAASPWTEIWCQLGTTPAESSLATDGQPRSKAPLPASYYARSLTHPFTLQHKPQPGKTNLARASDVPTVAPVVILSLVRHARPDLSAADTLATRSDRRHRFPDKTGPPLL